ncbi:hypothetical protein Ahy_B10g100859 [Arachis hypogaea]|uniref:SCP domain-containing protein n=1 Tax=Arachis hypogaea TaxID=3818 RepID=A0A444WXX0_ARAHY|nr:hypothetical protein Ahy_B10g100859 [Arachis hypogaea]
MKRLLKISLMVISFVSIIPSCLSSQNFPMEYLKGHNAARAKVGVKPLKWDKQLESLAHEFVNEHIADCYGMYIPHHFGSNYGQNIVHNPNRVSAASAVATWVAQKQNYEPKSNKCIDGNPASCHCYVQVVWGASTYLGCARGDCDNDEGTLITCYYDPTGTFPAQRPYLLLPKDASYLELLANALDRENWSLVQFMSSSYSGYDTSSLQQVKKFTNLPETIMYDLREGSLRGLEEGGTTKEIEFKLQK